MTLPSDIYIPPGSIPLDKVDHNFQLRLGIQGMPGTGKTFSAVSFPNPAVVSFDRGLISHMGRKDVIEIPFYDEKFVDKIHLRDGSSQPPNRKEAFTDWLQINSSKFTVSQTLIIDGGTGIQSSYHSWYRANEGNFLTKEGKIDKYIQWRMKVDYFAEIMLYLKSMKCNVIYLTHESPDRNKEGDLTGEVRPLLTGQFQDELVSHFTDWYRAVTISKPSPEKLEDFKKIGGTQEWINSTPNNCQTIYIWQTQSNEVAKCKTSLVGAPKYILANRSALLKYQRTNNT